MDTLKNEFLFKFPFLNRISWQFYFIPQSNSLLYSTTTFETGPLPGVVVRWGVGGVLYLYCQRWKSGNEWTFVMIRFRQLNIFAAYLKFSWTIFLSFTLFCVVVFRYGSIGIHLLVSSRCTLLKVTRLRTIALTTWHWGMCGMLLLGKETEEGAPNGWMDRWILSSITGRPPKVI